VVALNLPSSLVQVVALSAVSKLPPADLHAIRHAPSTTSIDAWCVFLELCDFGLIYHNFSINNNLDRFHGAQLEFKSLKQLQAYKVDAETSFLGNHLAPRSKLRLASVGKLCAWESPRKVKTKPPMENARLACPQQFVIFWRRLCELLSNHVPTTHPRWLGQAFQQDISQSRGCYRVSTTRCTIR
jgi:hypothetical protein